MCRLRNWSLDLKDIDTCTEYDVTFMLTSCINRFTTSKLNDVEKLKSIYSIEVRLLSIACTIYPTTVHSTLHIVASRSQI